MCQDQRSIAASCSGHHGVGGIEGANLDVVASMRLLNHGTSVTDGKCLDGHVHRLSFAAVKRYET